MSCSTVRIARVAFAALLVMIAAAPHAAGAQRPALNEYGNPQRLKPAPTTAAITPRDIVLEPSAGTGLLAILAEISGGSLLLNELAGTRADLLAALFPGCPVERHDAAQIDDYSDDALKPGLVVMNPPFSACVHVAGRARGTAMRHLRSAFARLDPGGRLHARANQGNTGRCVDGNNGGNPGNEVIVWDCNTQPWQHWTADNAAQTLVNDANHLCIEAAGTGVKLQACTGAPAQQWVVETR